MMTLEERLNNEILTLRANMDAITNRAQQRIVQARLKAIEDAAQRCLAQRITSEALDPLEAAHNLTCEAFASIIRAMQKPDRTTLDNAQRLGSRAAARPKPRSSSPKRQSGQSAAA